MSHTNATEAWRRAVLFSLMMAGIVATGKSQGVMVAAMSGLHFGMIYPHQRNPMIPYADLGAAQFSVTGLPGRSVRMVITATRPEGNGKELDLRLRNDECRYSIDGGTTWIAFSSGDLYHDLRFPVASGPGALSTIYVRVGGDISIAGSTEGARGPFLGSLRLTASYLDD